MLPKSTSKSTFFESGIGYGASGPKPQNLEIVLHFWTFFEGPGLRKSIKNRSKIHRETKLVSTSVSDSVLGRFSDDFESQNGAKNGPELDFSGLWKSTGFRRHGNQRASPRPNGARRFGTTLLGLHLIRSNLSIYLSIYLLTCSLSP